MALPLLSIDELAHGVYACVCSSLAEARTTLGTAYPGCPPCGGVVPGQISWDSCTGCGGDDCGGQLNVAVRRTYRTSPFPRPFNGIQGTKDCPATVNLAVELVVGLTRCVPGSDEFGNPPAPAALAAAAEILHVDMAAVGNALECCLPGLAPTQPRGLKFVIGETRVIGPSGGCVGLETTVTAELAGCPCPTDGGVNP